ncbi:MAG: EAL domain-containing protein [Steroidobacteraceae bacterium]
MPLRCEFTRAIEAGELYLKYQPVVHAATGEIHSLEALLRWHHPIYGHLAARDFAFVLQDPSLQEALSLLVLQEALQARARWVPHLGPIPVSINLSPRWLMSKTFLDRIEEGLSHAKGSHPAPLYIEIIEPDILRSTPTLLTNLQDACELGVQFMLDDFGSGYTSIAELRDLPLHGIKIDRHYVRHIAQNPQQASVILGMLHIAAGFGLLAMAEGVETQRQQTMLDRLGCHLMQGNGLCPPLAEDELCLLPKPVPYRPWRVSETDAKWHV